MATGKDIKGGRTPRVPPRRTLYFLYSVSYDLIVFIFYTGFTPRHLTMLIIVKAFWGKLRVNDVYIFNKTDASHCKTIAEEAYH